MGWGEPHEPKREHWLLEAAERSMTRLEATPRESLGPAGRILLPEPPSPIEEFFQVLDRELLELESEHRPQWSTPEAKALGKDPIGCMICWPSDGSWPCISKMCVEEIRKATPFDARGRPNTEQN